MAALWVWVMAMNDDEAAGIGGCNTYAVRNGTLRRGDGTVPFLNAL
jgi:hypothetical protein